MSNQVSLKAQRRTALGRNAVKKVKAEKAVPAILYGSGVEPQPLQVERRDPAGENDPYWSLRLQLRYRSAD